MGPVLPLVTENAEQTRQVGEALAAILAGGDVISLSGDLGAGKTTFVQGVARGLDVTQPVVSPTFTLVREYRGSLPVYHVDVYRLGRIQEVLDLGLDEMLDSDAVVFVEWGDAVESLLPETRLEVDLFMGPNDDARRLVLSAAGTSWARRWGRLQEVMRPWAGAA